MQSLREQAASLRATLTNSESHRRSLELELGNLRSELDSLRAQISSAASSPSLERQVKEANPPCLPQTLNPISGPIIINYETNMF